MKIPTLDRTESLWAWFFLGWLVNVRIADGSQEANRWLCCQVEGGAWYGAGDETKLVVILRTFLDWARFDINAVSIGL